jgi:DNA-binding transcriptional ArsR family regulator
LDSFSRLLWWLFSSSAGARSRTEIVRALRTEPRNAQQLAEALGIDYSTVRHHLKVLQQNRLLESSGEHYGQIYVLAPLLEERWEELERIVAKQRGR